MAKVQFLRDLHLSSARSDLMFQQGCQKVSMIIAR